MWGREGGTGRDGETCSLPGSTGLRGEPMEPSTEPHWIFSLPKPEGCRRRLVWAAWETGSKLTVQRVRDQEGFLLTAGQLRDRSTPTTWPHTATIHQGDTDTKKGNFNHMTTPQNISSGRRERLITPHKAVNEALPWHTTYNNGYPIMKWMKKMKK